MKIFVETFPHLECESGGAGSKRLEMWLQSTWNNHRFDNLVPKKYSSLLCQLVLVSLFGPLARGFSMWSMSQICHWLSHWCPIGSIDDKCEDGLFIKMILSSKFNLKYRTWMGRDVVSDWMVMRIFVKEGKVRTVTRSLSQNPTF